MKTIAPYAEQKLRENYRNFVNHWEDENPSYDPYTFTEWIELELESDPGFYRWLFNDENISDFGSNLTNEEMQTALDFFATL